MRRRDVISTLVLLGLAPPASAHAPGRTYRLGVLGPGDASSWPVSPVRRITLPKLAEYGFRERSNLEVDARYGDPGSLPKLASQLLTQRPEMIVAVSHLPFLLRGMRPQPFRVSCPSPAWILSQPA